jgi:rod shape determining protein RodA
MNYSNVQFSGLSALFKIDLKLFVLVMLIVVIGLATLFSVSGGDINLIFKQLIRIAIGLTAMIILAQIHPDNFRLFSPFLYIFGIILLILTIFFGVGKSADRWLDLYFLRFQPSELMKLFVPLMIASFYSDKALPPKLKNLSIAVIIIIIPGLLIAKQPDLGTALLITSSGVIAIFLSGIKLAHIFLGTVLVIGAIPLLWSFMYEYQKSRILSFFSPNTDTLGTGYHLAQSKISLGSGGLFGKGYMNGTQSQLDFLPENHTDFIFSAFGEEFGFIGVIILMSLYVLVALRGMSISIKASDNFSRILSATLILTIFLYVLVNVGMVVGILPIVGAPLPFMSYGGTSMLTVFAALGIIMSIKSHQRLLRK